MTDRYDRRARGYARHWAPVLSPTALRVLDLAAGWVPHEGRGMTVLDVGAGTGTLTVAAKRRWPAAEVIGVDPSEGMLAEAHRAARGMRPAPRFVTGPAEAIPLPDASVDLAVSSFVLQLVPDRPAALREIWRVLRPGGRLAFVTWLVDDREFVAGKAFEAAVDDLGVDEPDEEELPRAGDIASAGAAAAQLRRARFADVGARAVLLEHPWTADSYLAYRLECFDEEWVATLTRHQRARLASLARERLDAISPDGLRFRADVVVAWGRRPAVP